MIQFVETLTTCSGRTPTEPPAYVRIHQGDRQYSTAGGHILHSGTQRRTESQQHAVDLCNMCHHDDVRSIYEFVAHGTKLSVVESRTSKKYTRNTSYVIKSYRYETV